MYRIMIIDDEPNILNALKRALGGKGDWEIETYGSAGDALKRAQTANFELFISDYRMPDIDGVEFLTRVKDLQPESMRMILSGFTDLEALLGSINKAEIFRFICKPWNEYELVAAIKLALAHRSVLVENRRLADQVRQQQMELENRKSALERFAERHPALVDINWAPDGSIVLEDEHEQSH